MTDAILIITNPIFADHIAHFERTFHAEIVAAIENGTDLPEEFAGLVTLTKVDGNTKSSNAYRLEWA